MATAVVAGSLAVALALSLVGANAGAADWSPALRIGILAAIAIAALLIRAARGFTAERR